MTAMHDHWHGCCLKIDVSLFCLFSIASPSFIGQSVAMSFEVDRKRCCDQSSLPVPELECATLRVRARENCGPLHGTPCLNTRFWVTYCQPRMDYRELYCKLNYKLMVSIFDCNIVITRITTVTIPVYLFRMVMANGSSDFRNRHDGGTGQFTWR